MSFTKKYGLQTKRALCNEAGFSADFHNFFLLLQINNAISGPLLVPPHKTMYNKSTQRDVAWGWKFFTQTESIIDPLLKVITIYGTEKTSGRKAGDKVSLMACPSVKWQATKCRVSEIPRHSPGTKTLGFPHRFLNFFLTFLRQYYLCYLYYLICKCEGSLS